jgi:succinate-semialdehyde dehydrogenase/glutarate-semialdehyde dehydrogenase
MSCGAGITRIASINPATGEVLERFEPLGPAELEAVLSRGTEAFHRWRREPMAARAERLYRAAEILLAEREVLGRTMSLEMGKTLRAAIQEAEKCAAACRYFAENAARFLADVDLGAEKPGAFVRYQPLGVVLAVMPWNFPFWQVFRFAAPGLMAGNVGLLKHASNVPRCARAIEDLLRRAGFPAGVFQSLLATADVVPGLIADPRVAAVTLTGSVGAGSKVAARAGEHIKKTVLELGGSDPFIVMPSADLERAVETAVQARILNNGQSCIAAKRFIVHARVAKEFEARLVARMAALKVGDPMDPATDLGPLATEEGRRLLDQQVRATVARGARVLLGGQPLAGRGFFYPPTVLTDIPRGTPAWEDELFGPVAALFIVGGLEQAIQMANDTPFGLGASVWTQDPSEREAFIEEIQAGLVFLNNMVASDPRVPFGGVKRSGYGRELSREGILEFVNHKAVVT